MNAVNSTPVGTVSPKPSRQIEWADPAFLREVERRSGAPVSACFQCHKCSSGCPVGPDMDLLSSQVMRLVNLGAKDEVLESEAIWACASCEACTARCPMGIDIAAVMDTLRMMAVERKAALADTRGSSFNRAFLTSVRWHGRVFEAGMMALYKLFSRDFFSDLEKLPKMLAKRKLSFLPHFSRSARQVRKVFRRAEEEEKSRSGFSETGPVPQERTQEKSKL
jgi:heterodisulfide reductase subunit C